LPRYEYACRDCGRHVEVVQSFRDAALTTCASCGGQLRKVYGTAGIIFKGSGYYVNDSRAPAKSEGGGTKTDSTKKDGAAASPSGGGEGKSSTASGSESAA
jgi:putative FmdB family regulatory protein